MTLNIDTSEHEKSPRISTPEAAQALCSRLLETSAELVDLLDRETAMLKQGKPSEISTVQVRKSALNAMLIHDMMTFRRDAEYISMAAPDEIEAIKARHGHLQKSINANQDALIAMKAVSESLLHTIASKASTTVAGPETYGKGANVTVGAPARPAAISVNTVL